MLHTLVLPVLNEIAGLKSIVPQINRKWFEQILVLDGGSTDGSIEWCQAAGLEVHVQTKKGLRHGYSEILEKIRGDYITLFSPDGNSVAELLPALTAKVEEGFDMVIVSRYLEGAKSYDDDIVTAFGNWFFTKTVNVLFRASYTDAMVMYRSFRKQIIYDLALDQEASFAVEERLFGTVISWEPLLSARAAKHKLKVTEIPGDEPARIGGERKLQVLRWGAAYYFQFLREFLVFGKYWTPSPVPKSEPIEKFAL